MILEVLANLNYKIKSLWYGLWPENSPSLLLLIIAAAVALVTALPLFYSFWQGITADIGRWRLLWNQRIPALLASTLSLTVVVTLAGIFLGLALAWLVVRTNLPGHRFFSWSLVIPLVIPTYVGALSYIMAFGPVGLLQEYINLPADIYSFPGVALVMTMFTYPYVFLISSSSLRRLNPHLHEMSRSCGLSALEIFRRVELPLLRPALGAGGYLIALYVLADFGAVTMLRYDTFATSIYFQMTGRFDREGAAVLSLVLITLTLTLVMLEYLSRRRGHYQHKIESKQQLPRLELGKWRWPLFLLVTIIFAAGVILPVAVLSRWLFQGISRGGVEWNILPFIFNSILSSALAALIAMAVSLPLVYLRIRYSNKLTETLNNMAASAYILPGVVVALGLIFIFNNYLPSLYGTLVVMLLALIIKYLPLSLQSSEANFRLVADSLEDAARNMGVSGLKLLRRVVLPLVLPGVLAGGALVFVSSMKELTTVLMLRPAGFDTLSIRVWLQASEGFYAEAAFPALILILVSLLPLKLMIDRF